MQLLNTFTLLNPYLNNEQLHNATREFPFLKKFALHCMMCESTFPKFSYEEGSLIIYIYSFGCFHLKYTFDNVFEIDPSFMYQTVKNVDFDIDIIRGMYRLQYEIQKENSEEAIIIPIIFNDFEVEISIENILSTIYFDLNPWNYMSTLSLFLRVKYEVLPKDCNELELELMPLLDELATLCDNAPYAGMPKYPLLKELATTHHLDKLVSKFNQLEKLNIGTVHFDLVKMSVVEILSKYENRNIWLELYERIQLSQKEYGYRNSDFSSNLIDTITNRLHQLDYEGTYPLFYKKTNINHPYMTLSHDNLVFGGFDKNAICYIRCMDTISFAGKNQIQFIASTNLKPEDNDVYSTYFYRNGKCIYDYLVYDDTKTIDINDYIDSAVSMSQLKRLNLKQQDLYENSIFNPIVFVAYFILLGGFCAVTMSLAFFVFAYVVTFFFTSFAEANAIIFSLPWKIIFFGLWVTFGSLYAIAQHIASNK